MRFFSRTPLFLGMIGGLILLAGGWLSSSHETLRFDGQSRSLSKAAPSEAQEMAMQSPVTILFGGDMQFDRYIRSVTGKQGGAFVFDGLRAEFQRADLVVANLEGPITDNPSVSETSLEGSHDNYVFTFPTETAALLKAENVGLVNIGNNHILNFEEDGVRQTKEHLEAAGVGYFGSPLSGDERVAYREIGGAQFGFVNYNKFAWKGYEKVLADITLAKERADFVVVYTHWGKEYVEATPEMKTLAHEFIDAGADLVIGSHPHVVQEREEYRGKRIYYSLGNLIFDQYFRPETQAGLLIRAQFDPVTRDILLTELPVRLKTNGQTELVAR
jgi:poly-gamma-glutamate synthesis protein (capsule biosynthesis protein)